MVTLSALPYEVRFIKYFYFEYTTNKNICSGKALLCANMSLMNIPSKKKKPVIDESPTHQQHSFHLYK